MAEIQFSANPLGFRPLDFVMMDGRGNKGSPSKRQRMPVELSEAARARHEEKKRKNREAVRKHRERRRLKNTKGKSSRQHSSSVNVNTDTDDYDPMPSKTRGTMSTMPPGSSESPAQHQALMALADAALLERVRSSPENLPDDIHRNLPSCASMRSVSSQTDNFGLSSDIFPPITRSVAVQTPDFCLGSLDYRLRKCTWSNDQIDRPRFPAAVAHDRSTVSYN